MKYLLLNIALLFAYTTTNAQFHPSENGLTIIVTDGTEDGKDSKTISRDDIPSSYDQINRRPGSSNKAGASKNKNQNVFTDPIRSLGMKECIQAAAFLERPQFGKLGFMLIFSINDAIGGKQATLIKNGKTYQGVYRLVKQKTSSEEVVPQGMTTYKVEGTFLLLGIS